MDGSDVLTVSRPPYTITTDPARLDLERVWGWLRSTYWARGIPREVVARAFRGSLAFAVLEGDQQVGVARVVTDRSTFAYLADVFVEERARGRGLALWLVRVILGHPDLQGLRRWMLATSDAHGLYERVGFRRLANPGAFMEVHRPDAYLAQGSD